MRPKPSRECFLCACNLSLTNDALRSDQWDTWAEGKLEFVPLGPDYKGQTTTVLRSEGTYMPTAGAARVERNSSPETNFEPSSRPKL